MNESFYKTYLTAEEVHNIWLHMSGRAEGVIEAGGEADLPFMFANAIIQYYETKPK